MSSLLYRTREEQKSLKASYDRARHTLAATMKRKKEAKREAEEAIARALVTPEQKIAQNIAQTQSWWGGKS